jgi:hypothetical protein
MTVWKCYLEQPLHERKGLEGELLSDLLGYNIAGIGFHHFALRGLCWSDKATREGQADSKVSLTACFELRIRILVAPTGKELNLL